MERQQTDPEVIRLIQALEQAQDEGLTALADQISEMIQARGQFLNAADTQAVLAEAFALLTAYFVFMATSTRDTQVEIARSQVEKNLRQDVDLLRRAGAPEEYIRQYETTLRAYPDRVRRAFYTRVHPADQISYQFRIKTIRTGTERTVRNLVRNGNRRGMSALQIAQRVTAYLKPGIVAPRIEPLKEARIAAGASKSHKPRGVRPGKLPYQAMRIARTESAETYRAAHSQMYERTIFRDGLYDWLLSNSHPGPDVCDRNARRGPYRANRRPYSHPNCLCTWNKRPPTLAEVRALLRKDGVIQ